MYRTTKIFKLIFLCLLFLVNIASANESSIRVVTSFSILENLVNELGGQYVSVINLVNRNSDAHMYQPKPSDAVSIAKADLVIAPMLLITEATNVFWKYQKFSDYPYDKCEKSIDHIVSLPDEYVNELQLYRESFIRLYIGQIGL